MHSRKAFSRVVLSAVAVIVAVGTLGGCSGGSGPGGSGGTGLDAALASVADTAVARTQVSYDDTAELVRLSGTRPSTKGFALLRGWGASSLMDLSAQLPSDTGISLLTEDYAISAGEPPQMATLLHGGQNASLVTSRLGKLGWKQHDGALAGPLPTGGDGSELTGLYALRMHVVRADGSDVRLGQSVAVTDQLGSPSGSTLAGNPLISALADCLGDVVAAQIQTGEDLGGRSPAAVAIGVRRPASNTATPHAVACVAWSGQAAATRYTADVRKALSSGMSPVTEQPYSDLLSHPSVASIGGIQNIVQWQADTPGRANLIFQMYMNRDLPALPNCAKLPTAAAGTVIGCPG